MSPPAHLAFLLHMHQPLYVDPLSGRAVMPWVRLHGGRSYLDVATLLERHPDVHLTVNFVPSLVDQLEAVAAGASDAYLDVAMQHEWSPDDRTFLVTRFFSIHWGRAVEPRPRYRELLDKRGREVPAAERARRAQAFTDRELRDLTVLFHLAWLGFAIRDGDAELARLEKKGRDYDAADLAFVVTRGRDACRRVLPLYRSLAERGQVELASSPYYHPIVPLLCDSDAGRRAVPSMKLPDRFAWPDDARVHVERARARHAELFGAPPVGMWPAEGSVSPEAAAVYRDAGVRWLATDEGNLWRSLEQAVPRGALYQPWRHDGMDLVFRDRDLSDRVSFAYAFGETDASVADLVGRAERAASEARAAGVEGTPLVPVILDGENPWEAYPQNGEPFLDALCRALSSSKTLRAVSIGEHLAQFPSTATLARLHSGSWIDADFHIWIGDPVKNRAWDLLGRARRRYARAVDEKRVAQGQLDAAFEHLLAAEGSDWFWWFGEPFHTAEKDIFDRLFRNHLAAAWRALGLQVPPELGEPVERGGGPPPTSLARAPRGFIVPRVDGRRSSYFEWLDAGQYDVPRGAAMAAVPLVTALHYGFGPDAFYLRLDPAEGAGARLRAASVEVVLRGPRRVVRLVAAPGESTLTLVERDAPDDLVRDDAPPDGARRVGTYACLDIVELGVPRDALAFADDDRLELAVRLLDGRIQIGRYPGDGFLAVTVPDPGFAVDNWCV